jgi:hypothetical protein
MEIKEPYPQCATCKVLDDCPYPEVDNNFLGTPLPPDECPRPIEVMKRTHKKHKLNKQKN